MRASLPHLSSLIGEKAAPEAFVRHLGAARLPLQSRLEVSSVPSPGYIRDVCAECNAVQSTWCILCRL